MKTEKILVKYNKFDIHALLDQALRKNRVESEIALDLLVTMKSQLENDEEVYNRIRNSKMNDPIEDAKAMCAEDVL